jgi:hypothetical protein
MESVVQEDDSKSAGIASAGLGKAFSLRSPSSSLSVPLSWSTAAPLIGPASAAPAEVAPEPAAGSSRGRTFQLGLMAMLTGKGAITALIEGVDQTDDAESVEAETQLVYDVLACGGDSSPAGTLIPLSEPSQTIDATGHDAPAAAIAHAANTATIIRVLRGHPTAVPFGSSVILGLASTMHVTGGFVTVAGAGVRVANVPVIVNAGSTVKILNTCHADGTVVPFDTQLTATFGPIALTQYRHANVEVELVSGSATTGMSTRMAEVTTHAFRSATATVGEEGATIANTEGTVTVTTDQPSHLVCC